MALGITLCDGPCAGFFGSLFEARFLILRKLQQRVLGLLRAIGGEQTLSQVLVLILLYLLAIAFTTFSRSGIARTFADSPLVLTLEQVSNHGLLLQVLLIKLLSFLYYFHWQILITTLIHFFLLLLTHAIGYDTRALTWSFRQRSGNIS